LITIITFKMLSDQQKIGAFLIAFSLFFTTFGVLLFFDKGLLSVGNLLVLPGVVLILGLQRTKDFLFQQKKILGLVCFFGGLVLVLFGWGVIGFLMELFGFVNLFGNFFSSCLFICEIPHLFCNRTVEESN